MAEAIFNSLLRYGVAVFLKPVYDEEDLKERKLPKNTYTLQTLQNSMIRVIYGLKIQNRVNMKNVREKIKMMSVNQMAVYHTLLEAYNVMSHLSSEQIKMKWMGFTYNGAKLFNMLPPQTREIKDPNAFKTEMKNWIWENILSY